ncbi:MAG: ATPase, T2SS/T4P/T4SS family, partial [Candidatus Baltobacteraceae bacterium]
MNSPFYVFVGSKGGVGTSTLCHDLAAALSERSSAALVDADFSGRRSLAVLTRLGKTLDSARTTSQVAVAKKGTLTIVELTDSYDMALSLDGKTVDTVVEQLSDGYAAVYIDAAQPFAVAARAFIARAGRLLLVVRPDLLGMTGARAMLNELIRFGIPKQRIVAVVNWHSGRPEIAKREVEAALGVRVVAEIPPLGERTYKRATEALNDYLLHVPPEPPIASLQPSASAPLGERRRDTLPAQREDPVAPARSERRAALKQQIHEELGKRLDFVAASHASSDAEKLGELRAKIEELTRGILAERNDLGGPEEISEVRREVIDEALGLGPLEDLLGDESITEIMVNGPSEVYIERAGKIVRTEKRFTDAGQLRLVIDRIIAPIGRRVDESVPMVDARLPDGSRVNAIIEPLTLDGAALTIRRFGTRRLTADDLLRLGACNQAMLDFLSACIASRMNILISGGTG